MKDKDLSVVIAEMLRKQDQQTEILKMADRLDKIEKSFNDF